MYQGIISLLPTSTRTPPQSYRLPLSKPVHFSNPTPSKGRNNIDQEAKSLRPVETGSVWMTQPHFLFQAPVLLIPSLANTERPFPPPPSCVAAKHVEKGKKITVMARLRPGPSFGDPSPWSQPSCCLVDPGENPSLLCDSAFSYLKWENGLNYLSTPFIAKTTWFFPELTNGHTMVETISPSHGLPG